MTITTAITTAITMTDSEEATKPPPAFCREWAVARSRERAAATPGRRQRDHEQKS
jgi:hypothetical protein